MLGLPICNHFYVAMDEMQIAVSSMGGLQVIRFGIHCVTLQKKNILYLTLVLENAVYDPLCFHFSVYRSLVESVAKMVYGLVDRFFQVHNLPFTVCHYNIM